MPTAPARAPAALAAPDDRENMVPTQTTPPVAKSSPPINGLLALSERPAGVMAVTTLSALLSRISGTSRVCFGHYLRDLCDYHEGSSGSSNAAKLTCTAADAPVPIGTAVTLGLIADLLITNAFVYAFPPGSVGRIAVSFTAGQKAWQLTVEDSGVAMRADGNRRDDALTIARLLVLRLDGRLEIPGVTGGTRCIITVPRPDAQA